MKPCPFCGRELSDLALRCLHCRKALAASSEPRRAGFPPLEWVRRFDARRREDVPSCRGPLAGIVFIGLAAWLILALEQTTWSAEIVFWLKRRYFALTREPVLSWYAVIFLQTFLLKLGLSLLVVAYLAVAGQKPAAALGLSGPLRLPGRKALLAFGAFCFLSAAASGLDPLSPAFPVHSLFEEALLAGNVIAVLSIVVVAPVAEEIFFRGFLYPAFAGRLGASASIVLVGALFAAAHAPQTSGEPGPLLWVFAGGLILTAVRAATGSTRAAIAFHAFYNGMLLVFGALRHAVLGY